MIVKILASASNFAGIHYNERKNDSGKSELLVAQNFGSLSLNAKATKADYINYMTSWCNKNTRVKKVQFHAVISAKGKELSLDKLKDIGVEFLNGMGYGKNPYLIYHHGDTNNKHIHLVSTRVDPNGNKVDDRFEKLRSQQVMHQVLSRDPQYEAEHALKDALQYQFSTMAQFRLLLELRGFKFVNRPDGIYLSKYGSVLSKVNEKSVNGRINAFLLPQKRANQLRAILSKYFTGKLDDQWQEFMKEKFELDIVFHQNKGHEIPYGYTIVDHTSKVVFKGSQVVKLKELLSSGQEKNVRAAVNDLLKEDVSLSEFTSALSKLGLKLDGSGNVRWDHGTFKLDSGRLKNLHKAERLKLASLIRVNDSSCKTVVGKLLGIRLSAIKSNYLTTDQHLGLKTTAEYLDKSKRWQEGLEHFGFCLLQDDKNVYLFSSRAPALINLEKSLGTIPENLPRHIPHITSLSIPDQSMDWSLTVTDMLEGIVHILADAQQRGNEEQKRKHSSIKLS